MDVNNVKGVWGGDEPLPTHNGHKAGKGGRKGEKKGGREGGKEGVWAWVGAYLPT